MRESNVFPGVENAAEDLGKWPLAIGIWGYGNAITSFVPHHWIDDDFEEGSPQCIMSSLLFVCMRSLRREPKGSITDVWFRERYMGMVEAAVHQCTKHDDCNKSLAGQSYIYSWQDGGNLEQVTVEAMRRLAHICITDKEVRNKSYGYLSSSMKGWLSSLEPLRQRHSIWNNMAGTAFMELWKNIFAMVLAMFPLAVEFHSVKEWIEEERGLWRKQKYSLCDQLHAILIRGQGLFPASATSWPAVALESVLTNNRAKQAEDHTAETPMVELLPLSALQSILVNKISDEDLKTLAIGAEWGSRKKVLDAFVSTPLGELQGFIAKEPALRGL